MRWRGPSLRAVAGGITTYVQFAGRIATEREEVRRIALDDGAVIMLNGNAAVRSAIKRMSAISFCAEMNNALPRRPARASLCSKSTTSSGEARAEFLGVFKLADASAFAEAAAGAFNGKVVRRGDELHLVRQQNGPSH